MKKTIIDRSKWTRGGINTPSSLQNRSRCKCRLGFEISQHYPEVQIEMILTPGSTNLPSDHWLIGNKRHTHNSDLAYACMMVNDSHLSTPFIEKELDVVPTRLRSLIPKQINSEQEREAILVKLFALGDRELIFVDKGGDAD